MFIADLNFFNFPTIKFKRPTEETLESFYEKLYEVFRLREMAGEDLKINLLQAIKKDEAELIKSAKKEVGKVYLYNEMIDALIDRFTLAESIDEEEFTRFKQMILEGGFIQDIELLRDSSQLLFKSNIGEFKASKLTDIFTCFKNPLVDFESDERHGRCHWLSIDFSKVIENENKVATGYVCTFAKKCKYLHSWIEVDIDSKPFVIDLTRNLLIPKKAYYYIMNISFPVYKISRETLIKDESIIESLTKENRWLSKLYLTNRHQAYQVYDILQSKKMESGEDSASEKI